MMRSAAVAAGIAALAMPAVAQADTTVKWPEKRDYFEGDTVRLKVASSERVSLIRVSWKGTPLRAVARRTLRNGTFSARLSAHGSYQLRVVVGARRQQRRLIVKAACERPPAEKGEIRLASPTARAGETLAYELVNTSKQGCLTAGADYALERLEPDGSWTHLNPGQLFPGHAVRIEPGKSLDKAAQIPADARAGSYRIVETASRGSTAELRLTAPFQVVP
jgi:hypothetical protein